MCQTSNVSGGPRQSSNHDPGVVLVSGLQVVGQQAKYKTALSIVLSHSPGPLVWSVEGWQLRLLNLKHLLHISGLTIPRSQDSLTSVEAQLDKMIR